MKKLLVASIALLIQATVFADGGAVLLRGEADDLAITVFASPAPLSVGSSDISVLIQSKRGLEPVLDADIRLVLHSETSNVEFEARPTRTQAQNKLLYAAPVSFATAGKWQIGVVVDRNGAEIRVTGAFEVDPAPPRAASYAAYIAFPPVIALLFLIRERLTRRRKLRE